MNVYLPGNITDMQGPCASGFHVPTREDWQGLKTIMDGLSMTADNWRVYLHLPLAGVLNENNTVSSQGTRGYYCSSSPYGDSNPTESSNLWFTSSNVNANYNDYRANGKSIRPFKDGYVAPDSTWTAISGTLGGAGIFRDTVNGLISITGDGTTGYTIADKNLGASSVYSDGDTLSETNCGKYYQRGNNYGFPWIGATTTSSTQVNASTYGPENYYSSSTFISGHVNWDSSNNDNLWGGVSGGINELKNAYIGNGLS